MPALTREELEDGYDHVAAAPADRGRLELIVARPAENERELADAGELDLEVGLIGDKWSRGGSGDEAPNPDAQVTVMNARATALVADSGEHAAWAPAGDQLYVDLDIGVENLPAGTQLGIGGAVIEVTAEPHLGCGKFVSRFGVDAMKFVNSDLGRRMRLRGVNTRVVVPGPIKVGDEVRKLA